MMGGWMQTVADCTNNLYIPIFRKKLTQKINDEYIAIQEVNEKSWFGIAVATDYNGSQLAVGADKQSMLPKNEIVSGEGTVYQYNIDTNNWERKGVSFISPDILSALSGTTGIHSIAIEQDTVIMGMPNLIHRGTSFPSGGAAIYKWSGSYWKNTGYASDNYPSFYMVNSMPILANIPPIIEPPVYPVSAIGSSVTLSSEDYAAVGNSKRNEVVLMKNRDVTTGSSISIIPVVNYLIE
jgi:hypothetical protein